MASNSKQKKGSTLSRDLLNLALLLAFIHVDPESYLGLNNNGRNMFNEYNGQPFFRENKILDDLSALGRFNGYIPSPRSVEISAYILNADNIQPINDDDIFSAVSSDQNQSQNNNDNERPLANLDDDSGVSDVDSGHQSSDEDGSSSQASTSASPEHSNEDEVVDWLFGGSSRLDQDDEDLAARAGIKMEPFDPLLQATSHHPARTNYVGLFESDESTNIFRDLDEILISSNSTTEEDDTTKIKQEQEDDDAQTTTPTTTNITIKQEDIEFAPDEEDVENQLMHIDDQLIRLDENLEDITGHLDEQLLNTATVATGDELLTQEQQNFLFAAMPEVMDPLHGWSLDHSHSMEDPNSMEIDQLIAAGLPSPMMPSPAGLSENSEKPKKNEDSSDGEVTIKQEHLEYGAEENINQLYNDDLEWFEPLLTAPMSPSESLASTYLPQDLLDDITEQDYVDEEASSHLQDHNYALSPYDECFGNTNSKSSYPAEFLEGATAMMSPASSSTGSSLFPTNRVSRDERKARELNLPFAVSEIVDLPIDGFNELLSRYTLNESQLMLCRDIRRRGKNKVAAQNCRKRKMDLISHLEEEVSKTRQQKQILLAEREELYRLRTEWTNKLMNLEASVLLGLNRNPETYSLDYSGPSVKVTTRLAKSKA